MPRVYDLDDCGLNQTMWAIREDLPRLGVHACSNRSRNVRRRSPAATQRVIASTAWSVPSTARFKRALGGAAARARSTRRAICGSNPVSAAQTRSPCQVMPLGPLSNTVIRPSRSIPTAPRPTGAGMAWFNLSIADQRRPCRPLRSVLRHWLTRRWRNADSSSANASLTSTAASSADRGGASTSVPSRSDSGSSASSQPESASATRARLSAVASGSNAVGVRQATEIPSAPRRSSAGHRRGKPTLASSQAASAPV